MSAADLVLDRPKHRSGTVAEDEMGRHADRVPHSPAVSAYVDAVFQATQVRPRVAHECVQGERFVVLSVPIGDRYDDLEWRARTDEAIAGIIQRDAPECLGSVVVEYVQHL